MKHFKTISPEELSENPFRLIGKDWTLITAGTPESYNTMTASWGSFGILWNKPAVTVYVRPSRYTYEFTEKHDEFTLSFFSEEYRSALNFCGSKSGRDYDKALETGLTPVSFGSSVAFEQAKLVILCKKIYFQDMESRNFLDEGAEKFYLAKDYHRIYIGEVLKIFRE
ncbi:MAG: flavin reductase family protein [Deferribacterales bacterium]